jgi:hypothetical protein
MVPQSSMTPESPMTPRTLQQHRRIFGNISSPSLPEVFLACLSVHLHLKFNVSLEVKHLNSSTQVLTIPVLEQEHVKCKELPAPMKAPKPW